MSRQKPISWSERKSKLKNRFLLPLAAFEWANEWAAYWLSRWAFVDVLDYVSKFAILVAVIGFFAGMSERRAEKHYLAWQVVNSAQGKGGSGGRMDALEALGADRVPLTDIDLSNADLLGIILREEALGGADLRGANLHHADLSGTYLARADLRWNPIRNRNTVLWNADLHWVTLDEACLQKTVLGCANLQYAKARNADFSDAWLGGADLRGADLRGSDLSRANLSGADLTGAVVTQAQLDSACLDDSSKLDASFVRRPSDQNCRVALSGVSALLAAGCKRPGDMVPLPFVVRIKKAIGSDSGIEELPKFRATSSDCEVHN